MATEEYALGHQEGYQKGWNAAMDAISIQRQWVGLTNEEIDLIVQKLFDSKHHTFNAFPRAIEAKLKEKNV